MAELASCSVARRAAPPAGGGSGHPANGLGRRAALRWRSRSPFASARSQPLQATPRPASGAPGPIHSQDTDADDALAQSMHGEPAVAHPLAKCRRDTCPQRFLAPPLLGRCLLAGAVVLPEPQLLSSIARRLVSRSRAATSWRSAFRRRRSIFSSMWRWRIAAASVACREVAFCSASRLTRSSALRWSFS